jgi:hypothetical protein
VAYYCSDIKKCTSNFFEKCMTNYGKWYMPFTDLLNIIEVYRIALLSNLANLILFTFVKLIVVIPNLFTCSELVKCCPCKKKTFWIMKKILQIVNTFFPITAHWKGLSNQVPSIYLFIQNIVHTGVLSNNRLLSMINLTG